MPLDTQPESCAWIFTSLTLSLFTVTFHCSYLFISYVLLDLSLSYVTCSLPVFPESCTIAPYCSCDPYVPDSFPLFSIYNLLTLNPWLCSVLYLSLSNPVCFYSSNIDYVSHFLLNSDKALTIDTSQVSTYQKLSLPLEPLPLNSTYSQKPFLQDSSTSHYLETLQKCPVPYICLKCLDCDKRQVQCAN